MRYQPLPVLIWRGDLRWLYPDGPVAVVGEDVCVCVIALHISTLAGSHTLMGVCNVSIGALPLAVPSTSVIQHNHPSINM